mgnify:FL=1
MVVTVILLGMVYALVITRPSESAVQRKILQLSGSTTKINPTLLNAPELKGLEDARVFGARPIDAQNSGVSRRNPFDGL